MPKARHKVMIGMMLTVVLCAGGVGAAAGQFTDPNSGPAPGTTDVRPALPSSPNELPPRIGRPPALKPTRSIEPSPLQSRPSTTVPGVREIIVPGASRTLPAPGGFGLPQRVTPVSLTDVMRVDPRWAYYGRMGPNSYAIWNSWGYYVPGADRRAPGFMFFPGSNSVVARPVDFMDFIRYSGNGPNWSNRVNNGLDAQAPQLHLNNNGSVTVNYQPSNWFNLPAGGAGSWNPNESNLMLDPQFPLSSPNAPMVGPGGAPSAPEPPSLLDQADDKFAARDYAGAAELYRQHIAGAPADGWAMRAMAISLFLAKRLDEGAAAMARAYTVSPEMADQPMPAAAFPRGASQVRDAISTASTFAERVRTDEAWLMAAVLLQSSGQPKGALKMVERAAAAGLDPVVAAKLRAALKP